MPWHHQVWIHMKSKAICNSCTVWYVIDCSINSLKDFLILLPTYYTISPVFANFHLALWCWKKSHYMQYQILQYVLYSTPSNGPWFFTLANQVWNEKKEGIPQCNLWGFTNNPELKIKATQSNFRSSFYDCHFVIERNHSSSICLCGPLRAFEVFLFHR